MYKTAGFMDSIGKLLGGGSKAVQQAAHVPAAAVLDPMSKLPPELLQRLQNARAAVMSTGDKAIGYGDMARRADRALLKQINRGAIEPGGLGKAVTSANRSVGYSPLAQMEHSVSTPAFRDAMRDFRAAQQEAANLTGLSRKNIMPLENIKNNPDRIYGAGNYGRKR